MILVIINRFVIRKRQADISTRGSRRQVLDEPSFSDWHGTRSNGVAHSNCRNSSTRAASTASGAALGRMRIMSLLEDAGFPFANANAVWIAVGLAGGPSENGTPQPGSKPIFGGPNWKNRCIPDRFGEIFKKKYCESYLQLIALSV